MAFDEEEGPAADEVYDAFVRERYPRLVGTIRLIVGDTGIAEDIVQETFARAWLQWSKLWPDGSPAGWTHRVATNLAISWRRRAMREVKAVTKLGRRTEFARPAPETHPELHEAVAALPLRQRTAVALHYILDLGIDEAAEAMGCRPGTVKSLLFQARQNLRDLLGEEYA